MSGAVTANDEAPSAARPQAQPAVFALGSELRAEDLLERIGARFRVRRHRPVETRRVHLDTPDWRLLRSGAELTGRGNGQLEHLELRLPSERGSTRQAVEDEPEFVWDLPAGGLRERLEPITDVRRLLPQMDVRAQVQAFDVLDEREKIVVRVDIEEARACSNRGDEFHPMGTVVRLRPLRGYEPEFEQLSSFLAQDVGLASAPSDDLERALAAAGRDPRAEVPSWRVELDPRESAGKAVRRVLRRFLEIMRASEGGLCADVDVEFLHDFRVAVRRSRSILGQMGAVLPPEVATRASEELAWLGRGTTWLRDLDVFVLQIQEHVRAGDELWMEFELVRDSLQAARAAELEAVRAMLASPRWAEFRSSWSTELGRSPTTLDPEAARVPIVDLASQRIVRLHRKVLKASRRLTLESPVEQWHGLRIRCKKLRYMTDAFGCLYPEKGLKRLVRRLKRLQELLGRFNDLQVQALTLRRFSTELTGLGPTALFAMGRLVERHDARAEALEPEILERLAQFAADQDRRRVEKLLSSAAR